RILGELEHALVECEPAQLAINVAVSRQSGSAGFDELVEVIVFGVAETGVDDRGVAHELHHRTARQSAGEFASPNLTRQLFVDLETVADVAHRADQLIEIAELRAEASDVHVDGAGSAEVVIPPY